MRVGAQRAAELDAVQPGHADVADHDVRPRALQRGPDRERVLEHGHLVPGAAEHRLHHEQDRAGRRRWHEDSAQPAAARLSVMRQRARPRARRRRGVGRQHPLSAAPHSSTRSYGASGLKQRVQPSYRPRRARSTRVGQARQRAVEQDDRRGREHPALAVARPSPPAAATSPRGRGASTARRRARAPPRRPPTRRRQRRAGRSRRRRFAALGTDRHGRRPRRPRSRLPQLDRVLGQQRRTLDRGSGRPRRRSPARRRGSVASRSPNVPSEPASLCDLTHERVRASSSPRAPTITAATASSSTFNAFQSLRAAPAPRGCCTVGRQPRIEARPTGCAAPR